MTESILFLTGHLARPRLEAVLHGMDPGFDWKVLDIGVKVAALMTEDIILRRLPDHGEADKIMLPGRCRADLDRLSDRYGVPVLRGPDELKDIPTYFGRAAEGGRSVEIRHQDLSPRSSMPPLSPSIDPQACRRLQRQGCRRHRTGRLRSDTPFPHLEETVRALKEKGYKVSIDSADTDELLRGGKAGADFLLSRMNRRFTSPMRFNRRRC
ncbi:MAG: DUF6513 domain-containing protein [Hyphomicrobiales bacterium]